MRGWVTRSVGATVVVVALLALAGCDQQEDTVGGGSCEDQYDLILKGEIEDFDGEADLDFKAKLDVREGDRAIGVVKLGENWYAVSSGVATRDAVSLPFVEEFSPLLDRCTDPEQFSLVLYVLNLESENGLAGPFDGELQAYCGTSPIPEERIDTWDAESDVTCEDL